MGTSHQSKQDTSDIPLTIFNQFIEELRISDIPETVIEDLNRTIVENGDLTENAIRKALTAETNHDISQEN